MIQAPTLSSLEEFQAIEDEQVNEAASSSRETRSTDAQRGKVHTDA
jgi:hypothetical protein